MNIEEQIRAIVKDELEKQKKATEFTPVAEFCQKKNISRGTLWRARKSGKLPDDAIVKIGKKIFVNESALANGNYRH